ncbi:MAG: PQ-loop domain-containing transporter [Janthinobacterium lividum]
MSNYNLLKIFKSKGFENFTTFMALVGITAAYIQAYKIFSLKCATAVSLSAVLIGLASSICWFIYGLAQRIMPLIISNIMGITGAILVVIGILIYG